MFTRRHKRKALRFRQWRRKSFAAFHSIGKHITIGNLKIIVADTLLGKQNTIDNINTVFSVNNLENIFEDTDDPLTEVQLLMLAIPCFSPKNNNGEGFILPLIYFSKWLKATPVVAFSHFFYFSLKQFQHIKKTNEERYYCHDWTHANLYQPKTNRSGENARSGNRQFFSY
ncbi:MAG TPA: hypothetical protein PK191_00120 [Niabella sp.]|nr:hypothetical protein [Niabella sp.]HOZ96505.1 hypothetical protein [Niabella sp.]HQW13314.1 hypothetical protein [Niabella sp.]HQX18646.1 hypothetical protein [Niabella sp.]HQX40299.1 hypothetical protein [Niabella sp.]